MVRHPDELKHHPGDEDEGAKTSEATQEAQAPMAENAAASTTE